MTEKDWICPKCGYEMRLKNSFLSCDSLECPVRFAPTISSLPRAVKIGWRKYAIEGRIGCWVYAVGQHKDALTRRPLPGVVVAVVSINRLLHVRAFRKAKRKPR